LLTHKPLPILPAEGVGAGGGGVGPGGGGVGPGGGGVGPDGGVGPGGGGGDPGGGVGPGGGGVDPGGGGGDPGVGVVGVVPPPPVEPGVGVGVTLVDVLVSVFAAEFELEPVFVAAALGLFSVSKNTPPSPPQAPSISVEATSASNKVLAWRFFLVPTEYIFRTFT
jgi:hypothetical protein